MEIRSKFFLAWRYFKPRRNAVSLITLISLVGVALGVAVLIVVLAVMTGFTDLMTKKLLETSGHIQIEDFTHRYIADPDRVVAAAEKAGCQALPITVQSVLVQNGNRFVPKNIIGIDPNQKDDRFNLKNKITSGKFSLEKNQAIVGNRVAWQLAAGEGNKLLIHSPARLAKMVNVQKNGSVEIKKQVGEVYLPDEFTVSGIFSFEKYDFDSSIIFVNRDDANELFEMPWGSAGAVYVWTPDPFEIDGIVRTLAHELPGLTISTWQEINRNLLGVLQMEKNMMFFLLVFIVLVAAFSITNTLITVVVQKTREIGLLRALGASSGTIMSVFILQGFFVGLIGTILGCSLGITVICFRNNILDFMSKVAKRPLFPPEFYYFNQLPAHITGHDLLLIGLISIVLCTLGAVIPAWRAARLTPAEALRYE